VIPSVSPTDPRVEREQVAAVFATLPSAAVADTLLAVVVAGSFYFVQGGSMGTLAWFGIHVLQKLRWPTVRAYFDDPQAAERSRHWTRVATRDLAASSAVWGLAPWMLLPAGNVPLSALLMLIILSLGSGGMLSVAPLRSVIFAHCVPSTVGLATALAWQGEPLELVLAGLCLLYLVFTLRYALRLHRLLTNTLVERFSKEDIAQELVRQNEIARRASEDKTRFFASASHDLRQPLHAIALFGAVLEKELRGQPQHASAARLMHAVQSLGTSLDTMLDVSRLDAGVVAAEPRSVPVNAVFQALQPLFERRAEEKGLHLRLRASPLAVHTDPDLLTRLLANVVENAIKYTEAGGVLVVARDRGGEVWIECYDTGVGIAPDQLPRVYREFYQVDNPGRDRSRGLGLGLSIVRRLADLLGAPIDMASRMGRGTRFRIVLPAAPVDFALVDARVRSDATVTGPDELPRRVLLLDDERDIGEAVAALLDVHGVECTVVTDEARAEQALAEARSARRPFEALLCDYRLADGADGLEAAKRLRTHGGDVPLLLVTGETSPERLQRVRESGVPVLFKPATAAALVRALADLNAQRAT
jgi:signal transduction histidine kinase/CheY-like chemotaxis protein